MKTGRLTQKRFERFLSFLKESGKIEDYRLGKTVFKWHQVEIKIKGSWHKLIVADYKEALKTIVANLF